MFLGLWYWDGGTSGGGLPRGRTRKILVTVKGARFLVPEDQLQEWLQDKEDEIVEQAVKPVLKRSKKRAKLVKSPEIEVKADDSWVRGLIEDANRRVQERIAFIRYQNDVALVLLMT